MVVKPGLRVASVAIVLNSNTAISGHCKASCRSLLGSGFMLMCSLMCSHMKLLRQLDPTMTFWYSAWHQYSNTMAFSNASSIAMVFMLMLWNPMDYPWISRTVKLLISTVSKY